MKRAPVLHSDAFLAAILFLVVAGPVAAQDSPLSWLNGARSAAGARSLSEDAVLSTTAALWASTLAAAGVLSHRGADGATVLDRYRAMGGTEAHVGEIIGAGPSLAAVEAGWMQSAEHRRLALAPGWTHTGWGTAAHGSSQVWVVLFVERLVAELSIEDGEGALSVSGRFVEPSAGKAFLWSGLNPVLPASWDERTGRFAFEVPSSGKEGYVRLGYVAPDGAFMLTNAFTLPRGTESPAAPVRFSPPAPSP